MSYLYLHSYGLLSTICQTAYCLLYTAYCLFVMTCWKRPSACLVALLKTQIFTINLYSSHLCLYMCICTLFLSRRRVCELHFQLSRVFNYELYTIQYLIGQKFVGQNCRNFVLVSKILSVEHFVQYFHTKVRQKWNKIVEISD